MVARDATANVAVPGEVRSPESAQAAYKNPHLTPGERVRDLMSRMTLEEKVAQMVGIWQRKAEMLVDASGKFDPGKARAAFK